jgi:hypothetical protein
VNIMHHAQYPNPPPQENNPAQPLDRLNPPQQNWKTTSKL